MSVNKGEKLVSLIVPAFNVEKYIEKCLEAIIEQTYRNIEIIIVDDGSSDGTWDKIAALMKIDPRIQGYQQQNKGVSAARNYALENANGDYIQFVDADDYIAKETVEKLVTSIETSNADWVNFQYHRVDEAGNILDGSNFTKGYMDLSTQERKFIFLRDVLIEYYVGYEIWDKLYVADLIRDNNLKFDENCHMGEDLEFNICYALVSKSIICLDDRLYYYGVRSGSAMRSFTELSALFDERLTLLKGIQEPFESSFSGEYKYKFYQIFLKLMIHACLGYNANDVIDVADKAERQDYYLEELSKTVINKDGIKEAYPPERAMLYWRHAYFIYSHFRGSLKDKLYFWFYNTFRKIRRREAISELKLI